MPFPFLPAGVVLAASVLIGALVAFGLILRAMDKAIVGLRDNMLGGLVSGLRTWGSPRGDRPTVVSSLASTESPSGGSASIPAAEVVPAPEVIDLGSRPIKRRDDKDR